MKKNRLDLRGGAVSRFLCVFLAAVLTLSGCSFFPSAGSEPEQNGALAVTSGTGTGEESPERSTSAAAESETSSAAAEADETASVTEEAEGETSVAASAETSSAAVEADETASLSASAEGAAPAAAAGETAMEAAQAEPSLEDRIRDHVKEMSLEDKVSGLFILTPEALTGYGGVTEAGDVTREALENRPVAGLIYSTPNLQSWDQVQDMLRNTEEWGGTDLQDSGIHIPPFLAVDEEGGLVARVSDSPVEVPYVASMGEIGASGDPEAAYEAGNTIGRYLKELGFNLDFAPDADVLIDPYNQTIGSRSFGSDPALCGQMVGRFIDGLHENGVASCVKHFPGLGDTETDTHTGGAWSSRKLEDYRGAEFLSFGGGLEAGTDLVMISHLSNQELTGTDLPASMNRVVITQILREELGYDGLIITDSLQMGAVTDRADSAEAAVLALEAGADILLMPSDFEAARQGILTAVEEGRLSSERIDESVLRILTVRAGLQRDAGDR